MNPAIFCCIVPLGIAGVVFVFKGVDILNWLLDLVIDLANWNR